MANCLGKVSTAFSRTNNGNHLTQWPQSKDEQINYLNLNINNLFGVGCLLVFLFPNSTRHLNLSLCLTLSKKKSWILCNERLETGAFSECACHLVGSLFCFTVF